MSGTVYTRVYTCIYYILEIATSSGQSRPFAQNVRIFLRPLFMAQKIGFGKCGATDCTRSTGLLMLREIKLRKHLLFGNRMWIRCGYGALVDAAWRWRSPRDKLLRITGVDSIFFHLHAACTANSATTRALHGAWQA